MITEQLLISLGVAADKSKIWVPVLNAACVKYQINTPNRVAAFLSNCVHECGRFTVFTENLNYSSDALLRVFPKYFKTKVVADSVARKPQLIANIVYASRMGNGDSTTGDGWKYRGRGIIQITGKDNYSALTKDLGVDLIGNPDRLLEPELSAMSAAWFLFKNNILQYADKDDITTVRKRINGGTIGLDEVAKFYDICKKALS